MDRRFTGRKASLLAFSVDLTIVTLHYTTLASCIRAFRLQFYAHAIRIVANGIVLPFLDLFHRRDVSWQVACIVDLNRWPASYVQRWNSLWFRSLEIELFQIISFLRERCVFRQIRRSASQSVVRWIYFFFKRKYHILCDLREIDLPTSTCHKAIRGSDFWAHSQSDDSLRLLQCFDGNFWDVFKVFLVVLFSLLLWYCCFCFLSKSTSWLFHCFEILATPDCYAYRMGGASGSSFFKNRRQKSFLLHQRRLREKESLSAFEHLTRGRLAGVGGHSRIKYICTWTV